MANSLMKFAGGASQALTIKRIQECKNSPKKSNFIMVIKYNGILCAWWHRTEWVSIVGKQHLNSCCNVGWHVCFWKRTLKSPKILNVQIWKEDYWQNPENFFFRGGHFWRAKSKKCKKKFQKILLSQIVR